MHARVIENWLINCSERDFEVPFTQLLGIEGHVVIQGPAHHPYEHGKDILSFDREGNLCAFQLKGTRRRQTLADFEEHEAQVLALAQGVVDHSAVRPSRTADKVFFVTNQTFTPPASSRLRVLSLGCEEKGYAQIVAVEKDELVRRFLNCHGEFLPTEPEDIANFLRVLLEPGNSPLQSQLFLAALGDVLPISHPGQRRSACAQAIGSATLLSSYMTHSHRAEKNHLFEAIGWLLLCSQILRVAEVQTLREKYWVSSFDLAFESAQSALINLVDEALSVPDLTSRSIADGLVYGTRALLVCGFAAALYLSSAIRGESATIASSVRKLLRRESQYIRLLGEAGAPHLYAVALARAELGDVREGNGHLMSWMQTVSESNQPDSRVALPDPYLGFSELLQRPVGVLDNRFSSDRYDGRAYSLHCAVECLARRGFRQHLARHWELITRIHLHQLEPSAPDRYFAPRDADGDLKMWSYPLPTSWAWLVSESRKPGAPLPAALTSKMEFLPFLPLILPQRLTSEVVYKIDTLFDY